MTAHEVRWRLTARLASCKRSMVSAVVPSSIIESSNRVAPHAFRMGFLPCRLSRPRLPPGGPPGRAIRRRTARPAGPTRSGRPAVRTARPTGRAPRPSIARPGKWPDQPTRTAWPLPPLSAAQFAPSSLSGSSWHPSNSSRRSAAPTPCTLSQTRSSAGTLFGKKSPPAVHAEPASCRLARQPLPLDQPQLRHGHHFIAACSLRAGRRSKFAQTSARR